MRKGKWWWKVWGADSFGFWFVSRGGFVVWGVWGIRLVSMRPFL